MIDIALNAKTNDIYLDGSGSIATTRNLVQSVVIAFRMFLGEYDYNINLGMQWELAFSGGISEMDFMIDMEEQITLIEGIAESTVTIVKNNREITFDIFIRLETGLEYTFSILGDGSSVDY